MDLNLVIKKLSKQFEEYYASNNYKGTFDEEFLCGGYASRTSNDKPFEFKKTLNVNDLMQLIKWVAGTDYNFYDKNLKHYGFKNYSEYEKEKARVSKEIGLFDWEETANACAV